MKELLLVLVIAAISGYGYRIMSRLDHFLDENQKQEEQTEGLENRKDA